MMEVLTFDSLLTQLQVFFSYVLLLHVKILEGNFMKSQLKFPAVITYYF